MNLLLSTLPSLLLVKPSHQGLISSSLKQTLSTPEKLFHRILHRYCTVSKSSAPGKTGPTHSHKDTLWLPLFHTRRTRLHSFQYTQHMAPTSSVPEDWTLPFLSWAFSAPGHGTPPLPHEHCMVLFSVPENRVPPSGMDTTWFLYPQL